ncbi:MAG: sulfatase-like hydrolase/transferase [Eubacteriales bacterium]
MKKQSNILFIVTDDQRYNTIHALGNEEIITPNLDRLVAMGTAFTQAHIPGGTSGAICMPSRAMINSGRTLFHLDGEGQNIPEYHTTLGEALKAHDYHCFGTGKWHNGPPVFTRSFHEGSNIFFGGMWDHWNVPTSYYDPTGEYDNYINIVADWMHTNKSFKTLCDKFNPGVHSSQLLTDSSIEFLNQYEGEQPFYMYTAYLAPHDPRTMPEEFRQMYDASKLTLPENYVDMPENFGVEGIRDESLAPYPRTKENTLNQIADYYAMITHLDFEIGRLLDALEAKGELENTMIILAGDNGLAIGNHGLMGKQNHFDHSIRVPLIMAGPGIPVGEIRENYVYLLDIYPTICEMVGASIPESVEGISFAKMLTDKEYVTRETLYFVYNDLIRSVKDEQFKLIEYRTFMKKTQLFDLKNDPEEMHNLAGQKEYQEVQEKLSKLILQYRDEWDDKTHKFGQKYWANY